jgi:hypothetical protein
MSMNGVEHRIELSWIKSSSEIRDNQALLAAAYICRNDKKNPLEIIAMLGLADDLSSLRISRRSRTVGKEST